MALLLIVAMVRLAGAQAPEPRVTTALTLDAAIDSARRNSPDLLIARSVGDSARAESRIARALPNPTLAAIPNTPFQYSVTIPVDIGPQRWNRARVTDLGVAAATADVHDAERQIGLAVTRLYYDVLLADQRRQIVMARQGIMRELVRADSVRVHAGDLPARALIRSEVELIKAEADVARAGIDAQTSRLALQAQMGAARPDTTIQLADDLAFRDVPVDDVTDPLILRGEGRADVVAARTREAQAAAAQRLAASLLIPVPQLSYVRQITAPFESGRYTALGIGFELPFVNGYHGQRERASAGHIAAGLALRRVSAQAQRDIAVSLAVFRAQRMLVRQYESGVIGKVGENVQATRYAYSRGAASLLELLDALRAQQDVMTDYYTALHDYWVSVHAVRAATATSP